MQAAVDAARQRQADRGSTAEPEPIFSPAGGARPAATPVQIWPPKTTSVAPTSAVTQLMPQPVQDVEPAPPPASEVQPASQSQLALQPPPTLGPGSAVEPQPAFQPPQATEVESVADPEPAVQPPLVVESPPRPPVLPPQSPSAPKHRRPGPRFAAIAALAVVLVVVGTMGVALWSRSPASRAHHTAQSRPSHPASQAPSQSPTAVTSQTPGQASPRQLTSKGAIAANRAAAWIASQVNHGVLVACDQPMCDALTAHGFPASHLRYIWPKTPYPLTSQLVVVTPAILHQFGTSLASKWAPIQLTRFGTGQNAISIRVTAPHGATKYKAALTADLRHRQTAGSNMLRNKHVETSKRAGKQLASGHVDTRLIVVLTALAAVHPIHIRNFGGDFFGASPHLPLRIAYLAGSDPSSRLNQIDYLHFLVKQLSQEQGIYRPQLASLGHSGAGKPVFKIRFAWPERLGLLGGQSP